MGLKAYKRPDCQAADDGRTKVEFADEVDLGKLLDKAAVTGSLSHIETFGRQYGFATRIQYEDALNVIATGNSMFQELPSEVRQEFGNNPGRFLDFVQADENKDRLAELLPALAKPGRQLPTQERAQPEPAQPASAPAEPAAEPPQTPPAAS